jgi:hypothetical protein
MSFLDLIQPDTDADIRSRIKGFFVSAGMAVTNWREGAVIEQLYQASVDTVSAFTAIVAKAIRGTASLDTAVDPGDIDPYDSENETLDESPGFLSAKGLNDFGVERTGSSFATGDVLFVNAGAVARTISPYGLTFTWSENGPPSPAPTYHNVEDASIYVDGGGTVTIDAGSSLLLPVQCDIKGRQGSCSSGSLSLTTTLLGCSATNPNPITGNDRISADVYRAKCKAAQARLSLAGPRKIYEYLANTNLDGTPLLNASGIAVGITRVWVSEDSTTGIAQVYYATPSGAPIAEDVIAANENILKEALALPGCMTFVGQAAIETSIIVAGSVRIKSRAGISVDLVKQGILRNLAETWQDFPVGGFDQISGAGTIYLNDIERIVGNGYKGLYDVILTEPSASTAIPAGYVATLDSLMSDWTVTVVS